MLSPLNPSAKSSADFVVCDIENNPDGTVIDIDTCWRNQETKEIEHIRHENWSEFWAWVKSKARKHKKFRTIYAHNGGGWDWLSLADELLRELTTDKDAVSAIVAGSSMIVLSVRVSKYYTFKLCDSLQLLRSGLDKLGNQFLNRGKIDTGGLLPHELKEQNPDLYFEYLERDTETLLLVLETALETLRDNVAKIDNFGITIGSTAMKVFRTVGIETPITIPWDDKLKSLLREGYKGGRVECFNAGVFDRVYVYDINSLYPSVMRAFRVPISDRGNWTKKFVKNGVGVYRGRFRQVNRSIPAVMIDKGLSCYEGEGVFFTPEIDLLFEVDRLASFEVIEGFEFFDVDYIFKDYVEKLYQLRLDNPDTPLSLLCKFLLNSLYGKFGQNPLREQLIHVKEFDTLYDLIRDQAKVQVLDDHRGLFQVSTTSDCAFEHVGIAGTITSNARVRLYRGLLEAKNGLLYCDTDSVHCSKPISNRFIGSELGLFKKEFEGAGAYAGKKLYALRDGNGQEKIRAKGVSVGGRNGFSLNFDDLCRVVNGETIECEFFKPATVRQVWGGQAPCLFKPKKRRIKRTV